VLVHVERQDGHAAGEAIGMVSGPLDHEPAMPLRPGQQGPARTARLGLGAGGEGRAPDGDAAEVALQRSREFAFGIARAAEAVEIDLMQDHRVGGDQLLPLQPVDLEHRRRRPIKALKPSLDRVQAADGTAVVVLVMAGQQAFGEAVETGRLEGQRQDPVRHGILAWQHIDQEPDATPDSRRGFTGWGSPI